MTTQHHNPDTEASDDLAYYETELPAVIAGIRRGEKWEVRWTDGQWRPQTLNTLEPEGGKQ